MAMESVVLEKGEEVREYYPDAHLISIPFIPPFRDGSLAFTSKRVLWIMRMGKTSIHLDFPIERVKGITINYGLLHRTVTILDNKTSYAFELRGIDSNKAECPQGIVYLPISERKGEMKKSDADIVKIGMVFPPLKNHMGTEAQVLQTPNKPQSGSSGGINRSLDEDKIHLIQCHRQY